MRVYSAEHILPCKVVWFSHLENILRSKTPTTLKTEICSEQVKCYCYLRSTWNTLIVIMPRLYIQRGDNALPLSPPSLLPCIRPSVHPSIHRATAETIKILSGIMYAAHDHFQAGIHTLGLFHWFCIMVFLFSWQLVSELIGAQITVLHTYFSYHIQ